ncbi:hypothetical protein GYMLUDRAFT_45538 [Collybiopsis luxurians FD-317 M1]|uniref:Uncharacterized protein n=1 Tax=Collybiopsis luxurians FD-317 M1 TaxID=944289 RepID=A0A0D0CRR6_9AGAR|nr:hypothetical protein GYMLUDRAFT_45538 [Collybiopsis luxurians FD-317 M1]
MSQPSSSPKTEIIQLCSRHFSSIPLSLSRFQRQWFLTFPRTYGLPDPDSQRIVCVLNSPDYSAADEYAQRHFWLNPSCRSQRYNPSDTTTKYTFLSPLHLLLDSDCPVARLTGRIRSERSNDPHDAGKEIACYEVEVMAPDEGLLRQCYYCLSWEARGSTNVRFSASGGSDIYWCSSCEEAGWVHSTIRKFRLQDIFPWSNADSEYPKDNLYSPNRLISTA